MIQNDIALPLDLISLLEQDGYSLDDVDRIYEEEGW
jgi:hypothetical protein